MASDTVREGLASAIGGYARSKRHALHAADAILARWPHLLTDEELEAKLTEERAKLLEEMRVQVVADAKRNAAPIQGARP